MPEPSDEIATLCDTANGYMQAGRIHEAVDLYTKILIKDEKNALAWNNRGLGLMQAGHPFDAVLNLNKAIECKPDAAEFKMNLGAAYNDFEQTDKAIACYRDCIETNPNISHAHMNLGNALKWQGKHGAALVEYRKAVEIDPNYVDARLNRAFLELTMGNYQVGWDEFEWRWKSNQMVDRGLKQPQWNGEPLDGKTLLIYAEQGFGDSLQFMRYAPMVKQQWGGTVLIEVRQPLTRLMRTLQGIDGVVTFGDKVPDNIDYIIPVMSLPRVFGTTVENIPWPGRYFHIDQERVELWKKRLELMPPGMLVGVCWAGMSRTGKPIAEAVDRRRSTTLASFLPLAAVEGISWVSLQKGPPSEQIKTPPRGMTIGDWTEEFDDFYDTAAMIECLDLVVTVDTAIVHLAAALNKPTWLLSRWDGCWRWLGNRKDSPWYPSVRQFTQSKPNDWEGVMLEAAEELRQLVAKKQLLAA